MDQSSVKKRAAINGRGAVCNASGRFESQLREAFDDGWDDYTEESKPKTEIQADFALSILVYNK